jgi:hypothetical protein
LKVEFGRYGNGAAQESAVCYRAPSALHQEQIALVKYEDVERLERSDKNK